MSVTADPTSQSLIITPTLTRSTPVRLEKSVLGLLSGTLTVTLTSTSASHIRATVQSESHSYEVTLTADEAECSCPDSLHRGSGIVCKHATATALVASRKPEQPDIRHLAWSDSTVLCGEQQAVNVRRYPWPGTLASWEDTCASCRSTYENGYAYSVAHRPQGKLLKGGSIQKAKVAA